MDSTWAHTYSTIIFNHIKSNQQTFYLVFDTIFLMVLVWLFPRPSSWKRGEGAFCPSLAVCVPPASLRPLFVYINLWFPVQRLRGGWPEATRAGPGRIWGRTHHFLCREEGIQAGGKPPRVEQSGTGIFSQSSEGRRWSTSLS